MKILALSKLCHKEKSASQKEEWNLDYQEHNNRTHTHTKKSHKNTHTQTHIQRRTGLVLNVIIQVESVASKCPILLHGSTTVSTLESPPWRTTAGGPSRNRYIGTEW